jgi:hypothetical protein
MANGTEYKIIGSVTRPVLDRMQNLTEVIEVRFTFGEGHEGTIQVPKSTATQETIKMAIQAYVKLFEGL